MFATRKLRSIPGLLSARPFAATSHVPRRNYGDLRAYPSYPVFGETCLLNLKLMPPLFRYNARSHSISVDSTKKGRMLIEWIPRLPDGSLPHNQEGAVRFGLSPEEVGLILHQLPQQNSVELVRKTPASEALFDTAGGPQKVCKIVPDPEVASVTWTVDFEVDGVGGQEVQNIKGPYSVEMQAGEVQVVMEIMRQTIPTLVGWTTTCEVAMKKNLNDTLISSNNNAPSMGGGAFPTPDSF